MISVYYIDVDTRYYIDPLITSLKWSGDVNLAPRKLEVQLKNTLDGFSPYIDFETGKEIRFEEDGVELFRGIIFDLFTNRRGNLVIGAFDEGVYLTKNEDDRIFRSLTASAIVQQLCAEFGIPVGAIADTGFVIPNLLCRSKTLWDMIQMALTATRDNNSRTFIISFREGKLYLTERKEQVSRWVLEDGVNIEDATLSETIGDVRTRVKVVGGTQEEAKSVVVSDDELTSRFGVMQHVENVASDVPLSQITQIANTVLSQKTKIADEGSIDGLGITEVVAGTAIYAKQEMTGIIGAYYVTADEHTWSGASHKMSVKLSATDDLPMLEYEDDVAKMHIKAKKPLRKKAARAKKGGSDIVQLIKNANGVG